MNKGNLVKSVHSLIQLITVTLLRASCARYSARGTECICAEMISFLMEMTVHGEESLPTAALVSDFCFKMGKGKRSVFSRRDDLVKASFELPEGSHPRWEIPHKLHSGSRQLGPPCGAQGKPEVLGLQGAAAPPSWLGRILWGRRGSSSYPKSWLALA